MDSAALEHRPARYEGRPNPTTRIEDALNWTVMRTDPPQLAVQEAHGYVLRRTETSGALGDRLEDGLHVSRRPCDDVEDFCERSLALEGLLGLVEQVHVLNRDCGLIGERLEQRDLG